jgi:peptide chain release factor
MEKIIQITSGRGPAECTWVVAQVLKNVLQEAANDDIKASVLQHEAGQENGTVETATVVLEGKNVIQFVESWIGTIQWIGQSQFRKFNKRKNWFIGIFEVEKSNDLIINEKDIQYQAMRSSGAGGQHVNKVSSAIRATHIPSGIAVVVMDSRSQHQNKKLATERLLAKFKEESIKQLKSNVQNQWMNQLEIQRGNPVRVFQGSDFKNEKIVKNYKSKRQKLKQQLYNDSD